MIQVISTEFITKTYNINKSVRNNLLTRKNKMWTRRRRVDATAELNSERASVQQKSRPGSWLMRNSTCQPPPGSDVRTYAVSRPLNTHQSTQQRHPHLQVSRCTSRAVPIFIKGLKDCPANYRPISLIPVLKNGKSCTNVWKGVKIFPSKLSTHIAYSSI